MAQIYVNSGLVKPKSIHVYNSSAQLWEEDKIGYVRVNGEWIPFIQYFLFIYKGGIENTELVQGLATSPQNIIIDKQDTHIYLSNRYANEYLILRTDELIDVTNFKTLKAKVSKEGANDLRGVVGVTLSTGTTPQSWTWVVLTSTWIRDDIDTVISVDISDLSGDFYMCVGLQNGQISTAYYNLGIKEFWLE